MFAVKAENISKVYRFYQKPVHRLLEAILRKPMHTAFSALDQVSFSLGPGATLGIIGENGAGKSTLLKILARTLNPSSGTIEVTGRLAALLELGAGFHQEFSGRQNIFLNASLLGLTEKDIRDKEKEIVEFSELKEFIDRPLKSYSSGMVVRLAFSVATCIDPDVLIVDEALSVGDIRFQQKCIERMLKFRDSGKTLIFCSHSMYQVNELCSQALWLENGRVKALGDTSRIVSEFMNCLDMRDASANDRSCPAEAPAGPDRFEAEVLHVEVLDNAGNQVETIQEGQDLIVAVETRAIQENFQGHAGVAIFDAQDQMVFGAATKHSGCSCVNFNSRQRFEMKIISVPFRRGGYVFRGYILDRDCLRVIDEKPTGTYQAISRRPDLGYLGIEHRWLDMK